MTIGTLHSIATVLAMLAFAGVCWWAYRPANRQRFENIGRSPLEDDPILPHGNVRPQQENDK